MNVTILMKSGPSTADAERALQTADDMLARGHVVCLYLLQEAVRFCHLSAEYSHTAKQLDALIAKNLQVKVLVSDAKLRGIDVSAATSCMSEGSYESLVDLMTSCDRVIGIF